MAALHAIYGVLPHQLIRDFISWFLCFFRRKKTVCTKTVVLAKITDKVFLVERRNLDFRGSQPLLIGFFF